MACNSATLAVMTSHSASNIPLLRGPAALSHLLIHTLLSEGDKAVDATCGNGHDTLALAERTGPTGHIWGFDIQEQALAETGRRLSEAGLAGRATLLQAGHEEMSRHVAGPVKAVLFNLGYLPGGDRSIITRPETTVSALVQSLQLLEPGGIAMVTVYPGHGGGACEQQAVEVWAAGLAPQEYHSWKMGQMNVTSAAPYCILIQKVR